MIFGSHFIFFFIVSLSGNILFDVVNIKGLFSVHTVVMEVAKKKTFLVAQSLGGGGGKALVVGPLKKGPPLMARPLRPPPA